MTIDDAVDQLRISERGRIAMRDLLTFFNNGGLGLDINNQDAVVALITAAFNGKPGTVRDKLTEECECDLPT